MKVLSSLLLSSVAFAPCSALTSEPPAAVGESQRQAWEAFVDYALDFSKSYQYQDNGQALVLRRFRAFATSLERIEAHNAAYERGEFSFTLGLNELADLSDAEYRQLLSYRADSKRSGGAAETFSVAPESVQSLPESWDWRQHGAVTPVKNQGQCGSCWAFSAVAAMESAYQLSTGTLESFSEQELVDCTLGGVDDCNHGGEMSEGFEEIIQHHGGKIDREKDYEYTAESRGVCNAKDDKALGHFSAYANVTSGDEAALQAAVATKGVQAVAIDASSFTFQLYRHGVYSWPLCGNAPDALDHGVAAAGYGVYKKKDFWLVKNSWGDSWGMKGYIMMSRNKDNQCGIATDASYPIMTKEEDVPSEPRPVVVEETTEVASIMFEGHKFCIIMPQTV
ncbi:papain-like cysteine protease C1 [Phytophthora cinnamomi]|uniref:papain-like cysteine protease C1 n=1 Tax=Phytophthora cinnamomi TaxID=4785 RepID=UPI0035598598|nr:papain-like cysteine protease C1 [Phytophthora cinnamomi]